MSKWFSKGGDSSDDDSGSGFTTDEERIDDLSSDEKPMQGSKWFGGGDSDSDSDESSDDNVSGSESESESEGEGGPSRFFGADSDSDSDGGFGGRRVVRSGRRKWFDEFRSLSGTLRNHMNIGDWNCVRDDFDAVERHVGKYAGVLRSALLSSDVTTVPLAFLAVIREMQEAIAAVLGDKEAKKKLSPTNSKALNAMKQRAKKVIAQYAAEMERFEAMPEGALEAEAASTEEEPESESDDDDDDEERARRAGDDDDDEWETAGQRKGRKQQQPQVYGFAHPGRQIADADLQTRLTEILARKGKKGTAAESQTSDLQQLALYCSTGGRVVQVLLHLVASIFDANVSVHEHLPGAQWRAAYDALLRAVIALRAAGDRLTVVEDESVAAEELTHTDKGGERLVVPLVIARLYERLDDEFIKALQNTDPHKSDFAVRLQDEALLIDLGLRLHAYYGDRDAKKGAEKKDADGKSARVRVALRLIEHLYYKRYEQYQAELAVQRPLSALRELLTTVRKQKDEAYEHIRQDVPKSALESWPWTKNSGDSAADRELAIPERALPPTPRDLKAFVAELVEEIYAGGGDRARTRTILCHVYHLAVHREYERARNLFLMSHLQDTIHLSDTATQILFNRTVAQLGICAFCRGQLADAHQILHELVACQHAKELLAQALSQYSRHQQRTPEQEREERRRLTPFHMHISIDLLEACHLLSAMLIEVPFMAGQGNLADILGDSAGSLRHSSNHNKGRPDLCSRAFRRMLDFYERLVFTGPPENTRDFVYAATKALLRGDWRECHRHVAALKIFHFFGPDEREVRETVAEKIKSEGLRTYLLAYQDIYDAMSWEKLADLFEMKEKDVVAVVSRMILNQELPATLDNAQRLVLLHHVQPTRLQQLALQYAGKSAQMVEMNEKLLELKLGGLAGDQQGKEKEKDDQSGGAEYQSYGRQQWRPQTQWTTTNQRTGARRDLK